MLVDSHCHLTSERFENEVAETVSSALQAGVTWMVTIGSNNEDSRNAIRIAEEFSSVYAAAGIHPHEAASANEEAMAELRELVRHPRVVAVGETGIDYHYDNAPREKQIEVFEQQIEIARVEDLPVIVHAREADDDVADVIANSGWGRGVLHCFSGGEDLMRRALAVGWHISFAGMVTFKNWDQGGLLREVPLERLLVETDSPYLAPVPFRGKRNQPAHVREVAARVADLRGISFDELCATTSRNAADFYGVQL